MKIRHTIKHIGLAAAVLGLGAGLTIQSAGCGDGQASLSDPTTAQDSGSPLSSRLPLLDLEAPVSFQTATFAFG
jgi:hypothetical protein